MAKLFVVAAAVLAVSGCKMLKPPPPPEFHATIKVVGDPSQPLAGAQVLYGKKQIGVTNTLGVLDFKLKGAEGQVFDLTVKCPDGYQSPGKPVSVVLRKLADPKATPEYQVDCPPTMRTVVIAVKAENGPNLPVVYLGRERTRTDYSGAAHLTLQIPPNQSIQVKLDTTEAKDLRPQNPTKTLHVKDRDDVLVLEQNFQVERKKIYRRGPKKVGPIQL